MRDWCLEVWGDHACFTRPELKVERVSYDVITPSAARGIFEAILWKPAIRWNITRIEVLNPIKFTSIRRNEVGKTIPVPTEKQIQERKLTSEPLYIEDHRQQRAGLCLKDVRYRIYGYFDFIPIEQRKVHGPASGASDHHFATGMEDQGDEREEKYAAMFERRAARGQCFHRPYLGTREFACSFRLVDEDLEPSNPIDECRDFGYMLYDMSFDENSVSPPPLFFRAVMKKGVIITDRRIVKVVG